MSGIESYELLTASQMRNFEQMAISEGGATGRTLMERAGAAVVAEVFAHWPSLAAAPFRAVVLCGPGNNGGDGFVVARLLQDWGAQVEVFAFGDPDAMPPDASANCARWCAVGTVQPMQAADIEAGHLARADLVVDAIFGTGLTRALPAQVASFLRVGFDADIPDAGRGARTVAIDIPSGLNSDTGRVIGADGVGGGAQGDFLLPAALTVSFHRAKRGHYLAQGPEFCGTFRSVSIGLEGAVGQSGWRREGAAMRQPLNERCDLVCAPDPGIEARVSNPIAYADANALRKRSGHKFDHGHALIASGPMGRSGAARLAARAALRVGAGVVTVAAPGSAMMECASQLTAIMLRRCDDAQGLVDLLQDRRITALCLGPGLGAAAREMVLAASDAPGQEARARPGLVLDADALTAFADEPDALFEALNGPVVLTPHGGEFARLFPDLAQDRALSKVEATRAAAARAGAVVLYKGADTVIACPDGGVWLHSAAYGRSAPWLATAGSGDVLAGIIAGLMARGISALSSARLGAWLHVEAARVVGPGLIAEDLPEALPQVLARQSPAPD